MMTRMALAPTARSMAPPTPGGTPDPRWSSSQGRRSSETSKAPSRLTSRWPPRDHQKRVGVMDRSSRRHQRGLVLAGIDHVGVLRAGRRAWAHAEDAVLAVEDDLAARRDETRGQRWHADAEIDVGAFRRYPARRARPSDRGQRLQGLGIMPVLRQRRRGRRRCSACHVLPDRAAKLDHVVDLAPR